MKTKTFRLINCPTCWGERGLWGRLRRQRFASWRPCRACKGMGVIATRR